MKETSPAKRRFPSPAVTGTLLWAVFVLGASVIVAHARFTAVNRESLRSRSAMLADTRARVAAASADSPRSMATMMSREAIPSRS